VGEPRALRQLLHQERQAVLATLSLRRDGWPFASAVPYALSDDGLPLMLLSDLAEHTRNARADPRASLLVQDSSSADDPQAGARVTLLGTLQPEASDTAKSIYVSRHPAAREYLSMADFHVWRLEVDQARYVGGFGEMGWLEGITLRSALGR
jgi:heme oxygenase (biliverdin-IX-beta and delta-forming)